MSWISKVWGEKKKVLSKFEVDAILMISLTFFFVKMMSLECLWLRTWRATLCGYGPSIVQVCHNAKSYASAKGLGPDFFWCCNFQFHSGIPKSEGKTPTDKDQCETSTWFVSISQPHRPEKPFAKAGILPTAFGKTSAVWRKSGAQRVGAQCSLLGVDRYRTLSTFVVSNACIKIAFITQVDLSNLGYSQLSSKLRGPDSTRFRTCGSSFFGELQQSCSSMVEIVAWSA